MGSLPRSLALCFAVAPALAQSTTLISHSFTGGVSSQGGVAPAISPSGRWVAFAGGGSIVPGDTNGQTDVFVRDRQFNTNKRVNLSWNGAQADNHSGGASISADGHTVAFVSSATNLVPGDTNAFNDIFAVDVESGVIERVSVSSSGQQGDQESSYSFVSADGRFVAFYSYATNLVAGDTNVTPDAFLRDLLLGLTERVSVGVNGVEGTGGSSPGGISGDGRFVAFQSVADNLVPGDTGNWDVFVRDRVLATTERVSIDSNGVAANADCYRACMSLDGRCVTFESTASNLVPGDTNGLPDVFLHDRINGTTERINVSTSGVESSLESEGPGALSADGRFVAFATFANFSPLDTNQHIDVYVRDRLTGQTTLASISNAGVAGNMGSNRPSISAAGNMVAFQSNAKNFYVGDTNFARDVFVRDTCNPLPMFFADADGDSFGDAATTIGACSLPTGYAYEAGDCDDTDANVNPSATEICNAVDDDCDGAIDEGMLVYADVDGDGFGNASVSIVGCAPLAGYSADSTDCDDTNASIHPGAPELCDGLDNDCDGTPDDGISGVAYCLAGVTTHGCLPSIRGAGSPSVSATSGFHVIVDYVEGARSSLIEYSLARDFTTWAIGSGSWMCLQAPIQRTSALFSNGTSGACNGSLDLDWTAWRAAHPNALGNALLPGQSVYFQASFRDAPAYTGRNLSDGLAVLLCP